MQIASECSCIVLRNEPVKQTWKNGFEIDPPIFSYRSSLDTAKFAVNICKIIAVQIDNVRHGRLGENISFRLKHIQHGISVCKTLWACRSKIFAERSACKEVYDKIGYVICTEIGTHIEPSTLSDTYKRILEDAGIKKADFHSLRHTFATKAIKLGIDLKTVSEFLGHADVSVTLNCYAHSFDEQKRQAMKKIAAHLGA